jgi:hypothetical protein
MNTLSACEFTVFASAQILGSWHEQRPSSLDYFESGVMGEIEGVYYTGVDRLLI